MRMAHLLAADARPNWDPHDFPVPVEFRRDVTATFDNAAVHRDGEWVLLAWDARYLLEVGYGVDCAGIYSLATNDACLDVSRFVSVSVAAFVVKAKRDERDKVRFTVQYPKKGAPGGFSSKPVILEGDHLCVSSVLWAAHRFMAKRPTRVVLQSDASKSLDDQALRALPDDSVLRVQ